MQLPPLNSGLNSWEVVTFRVDATSYADATERIVHAATEGRSAFVCVANVHMVMEAFDDVAFQRIVNDADLVVPDGMPLVWALRLFKIREASRVRGPDLTLWIAKRAAQLGIPIAIYGGSEVVANKFAEFLKTQFNGLNVAAVISPPYRELSHSEEQAFSEEIKNSGARIVLVGLGCPKQEKWMARNVASTGAVLIGVGAAFDFHTGRVREAPAWMQATGLEWLFRLSQEPKRLWKRYAVHNPRFVGLLGRQFFMQRVLGRR